MIFLVVALASVFALGKRLLDLFDFALFSSLLHCCLILLVDCRCRLLPLCCRVAEWPEQQFVLFVAFAVAVLLSVVVALFLRLVPLCLVFLPFSLVWVIAALG